MNSAVLKQKFISGMVWTIGDKLVNQLGFFFVTVYLARVLGPQDFGLIGMLTIFILLADSLVNSGFSQALIQRSNKLTEAEASTVFYTNIIIAIAVYFVLYISTPWIAGFYQESKLINIAKVLFVVVIINSLSVVTRAKLTIKIDFKSQAIANGLATLIGASVAIMLAGAGYGYWSLVALTLIKSAVSMIVYWWFCDWKPQWVFCTQSFKRLFKFGSNLMIAGVVATLVNNLYIILVGRYYNALSVGYFMQSFNLANFMSQFISSTLRGVSYPLMTSRKDQKEQLISLYKQMLGLTMFVSFPALIGFAAIADSFVIIFLGKEWLPAVPLIQILCFSRAIIPISSINMNILNASGRSDLFLKIDLSKLPITLATLFLFISYGTKMVAFALLTNALIAFFINTYYLGVFFGFGAWQQLKIAKNYIFSSIIMFLIVHSVSFENPWANFGVGIFLGISVYLGLLWFFRDVMFKRLLSELACKFKFLQWSP